MATENLTLKSGDQTANISYNSLKYAISFREFVEDEMKKQ